MIENMLAFRTIETIRMSNMMVSKASWTPLKKLILYFLSIPALRMVPRLLILKSRRILTSS